METPKVPIEKYVRKHVVIDGRRFVDYVHNDDLIDIGPGTLRGQALDSVRLYRVNYDQAEKRIIGNIRRNVMRREYPNDSPCECMLPGFVPCADCGAGC